ncbi:MULTISPECIES: glycosyltransferase [unclassified Rhizobium]|uniref:glycosyltransferase family protein n=1 Tax=unclassified Rhizobium TaxID=2613769 RepID=UPI001FD9DF0A|nr:MULTISPECIES: glycosyltransferase [unclassified Rhizobium]
MLILTEEDERLAVTSGRSAQQLFVDAWQQAAPHMVFVSRYGGILAETLLQMSASKNTPLVYHIDDNLFEVPPEAGIDKVKKYGAPARQQAIRALLKGADAVYLSTARLAHQLREHTQLAGSVFAGEIASASDPIPYNRLVAPSQPRFGYMASSSHAADLQLALPGIIAGLTANPDVHFTVFGSLRPPPELGGFGPRVEHVPAVSDYDGFLSQLAAMRWDWGLAPLRPGRFNEAKTDTKWVEYTAAGVPTIVSDHPIYHDCSQNGAAVRVCDTKWAEALPQVLANRALAERTLAAARERLIQQHGLGHMATQLSHVLKLAGLSPERAEVVSKSHSASENQATVLKPD